MEPVGMAKLDLDRPTDTAHLDRTVEGRAVTCRRLRSGSPRGLACRRIREQADHIRGRMRDIECTSAEGVEMRDVPIGDRRGRCLDGRFAGVLRSRLLEYAVLDDAQADDGQRADADEDRRDDQRLTAFAAHGVHSMRRDALAVTTKLGSPANPSGTGRV